MTALLRLSWIELKLFLREPLTVIFSLALPVILLLVLGGVFGNQPSGPGQPVMYRGVGAMNFYVPAYLALIAASVCMISIPTHLAGNRERGVLKRFHASGVSVPVVLGSQVAVALVLSTLSAVILLLTAALAYEIDAPASPLGVIGVFLVTTLGFAGLGILLGAVLPTSRAAQAVGMLSWFVMLFLGGSGPPPEVLPQAMQTIMNATPLWHAVKMLQHPWLGLDPGISWLVFSGVAILSAVLAVRLFRWE
jgi:ABC-2 type transport system permease protein